MDEDQLSDADLWELKVDQGMSEQDATAYVGGRSRSSAPAAKREHSGLSDFMRMAAQSATFGFADELAGAMGGDTEASRARVAEIRENRPVVSAAGSLAGALPMALMPVGAAAQGVTRGAGLLATMGRGAAVGAVEGGLLGAGEAEEGGRARGAAAGAVVGGGIGGLAGGLTGAVTSALRRTAGRGQRVSEALQEGAGVRVNANAARDAADAGIDAVRQQHYAPLEAAFPEIKDPALTRVLNSQSVRRETAVIAPEVAGNKRAPSFDEAQRILLRLRRLNGPDRKFAEEITQLNSALESAVPGFREANQAYAQAMSLRTALTNGRRMYGKSAADIDRAMRGLSPEAREQFTHGRLAETVRRLEARDKAATGELKKLMDAGRETQAKLRSLFPDDESYNAFRQVLSREESAERVAAELRRLAPWAMTGLGIGAASQLIP